MMKRTTTLLLFVYSSIVFASTNINDLRQKIQQHQQQDEQFCAMLFEISSAYKYVNLDSSEYYNDKAFALAKDLKHKEYIAQAYNTKAGILIHKGKAQAAIPYLKEALTLDSTPEHRTRSHILMSTVELFDYRFEAALQHIEAILAFNSDPEVVMTCYEQKALVYKKWGNKKEELNHLLLAHDYALENNIALDAKLLYNIGITYSSLDNLDYAQRFIEKSIEIEKDETLHNWYAYMGLGEIYLNQQLYDSVHIVFQKARKMHEVTNHSMARGYYYYLEAEALLQEGNVDKALMIAQEGVQISIAQNDKKEEGDCYAAMAKIYLVQKDYVTALTYLDKAMPLSPNSQSNEIKSTIYAQLGKWEEAYKLLKTYHQKKDSTFNKNDILKANSELITYQYEQEQRTQQLENEKKQAVLEAHLAGHRRFRNLLITASTLLALLAFLIFRSYQRQQKANRIIQSQVEELARRADNLQELNTLKDRIFYIIGHDLRSPINSLNLLLNHVLSGKMPMDRFAALLPATKRNIASIELTLNNMLYWGLLQSKQLETHPTTVNLYQEVEQIKELLVELLRQKQLQFVNDIDKNIQALTDTSQLSIVLRNLITNSIKFTPKAGKIAIAATQTEKNIEIVVQDSGVGISKEQQERIFKTKSSTRGTEGEKGTGLGLDICKEIVEKNGGKIWTESMLGKGSIFRFTLPC